jgi:hypothetical protein
MNANTHNDLPDDAYWRYFAFIGGFRFLAVYRDHSGRLDAFDLEELTVSQSNSQRI